MVPETWQHQPLDLSVRFSSAADWTLKSKNYIPPPPSPPPTSPPPPFRPEITHRAFDSTLNCYILCTNGFYQSVCLCPFVSLCLSLCLCLSILVSVSLSLSLSLFLSRSVFLCVCLSVCLSLCPSLFLSVYLSACLSTPHPLSLEAYYKAQLS